MKRMQFALAVVSVFATFAVAAAQNQPLAGSYAVQFVFPGGAQYNGTLDLGPSRNQTIEGRLALEGPSRITGTITGTVDAPAIKFDVAYERADGCKSSGRGSGRIAEDGQVTGDVTLVDCAARERSGTFSWNRK